MDGLTHAFDQPFRWLLGFISARAASDQDEDDSYG